MQMDLQAENLVVPQQQDTLDLSDDGQAFIELVEAPYQSIQSNVTDQGNVIPVNHILTPEVQQKYYVEQLPQQFNTDDFEAVCLRSVTLSQLQSSLNEQSESLSNSIIMLNLQALVNSPNPRPLLTSSALIADFSDSLLKLSNAQNSPQSLNKSHHNSKKALKQSNPLFHQPVLLGSGLFDHSQILQISQEIDDQNHLLEYSTSAVQIDRLSMFEKYRVLTETFRLFKVWQRAATVCRFKRDKINQQLGDGMKNLTKHYLRLVPFQVLRSINRAVVHSNTKLQAKAFIMFVLRYNQMQMNGHQVFVMSQTFVQSKGINAMLKMLRLKNCSHRFSVFDDQYRISYTFAAWRFGLAVFSHMNKQRKALVLKSWINAKKKKLADYQYEKLVIRVSLQAIVQSAIYHKSVNQLTHWIEDVRKLKAIQLYRNLSENHQNIRLQQQILQQFVKRNQLGNQGVRDRITNMQLHDYDLILRDRILKSDGKIYEPTRDNVSVFVETIDGNLKQAVDQIVDIKDKIEVDRKLNWMRNRGRTHNQSISIVDQTEPKPLFEDENLVQSSIDIESQNQITEDLLKQQVQNCNLVVYIPQQSIKFNEVEQNLIQNNVKLVYFNRRNQQQKMNQNLILSEMKLLNLVHPHHQYCQIDYQSQIARIKGLQTNKKQKPSAISYQQIVQRPLSSPIYTLKNKLQTNSAKQIFLQNNNHNYFGLHFNTLFGQLSSLKLNNQYNPFLKEKDIQQLTLQYQSSQLQNKATPKLQVQKQQQKSSSDLLQNLINRLNQLSIYHAFFGWYVLTLKKIKYIQNQKLACSHFAISLKRKILNSLMNLVSAKSRQRIILQMARNSCIQFQKINYFNIWLDFTHRSQLLHHKEIYLTNYIKKQSLKYIFDLLLNANLKIYKLARSGLFMKFKEKLQYNLKLIAFRKMLANYQQLRLTENQIVGFRIKFIFHAWNSHVIATQQLNTIIAKINPKSTGNWFNIVQPCYRNAFNVWNSKNRQRVCAYAFLDKQRLLTQQKYFNIFKTYIIYLPFIQLKLSQLKLRVFDKWHYVFLKKVEFERRGNPLREFIQKKFMLKVLEQLRSKAQVYRLHNFQSSELRSSRDRLQLESAFNIMKYYSSFDSNLTEFINYYRQYKALFLLLLQLKIRVSRRYSHPNQILEIRTITTQLESQHNLLRRVQYIKIDAYRNSYSSLTKSLNQIIDYDYKFQFKISSLSALFGQKDKDLVISRTFQLEREAFKNSLIRKFNDIQNEVEIDKFDEFYQSKESDLLKQTGEIKEEHEENESILLSGFGDRIEKMLK